MGSTWDEQAMVPLAEACNDWNGFVRVVAHEMLEKLRVF
jgi:hypothetical protein